MHQVTVMLQDLPDDVLGHILGCLSSRDATTVRATCRRVLRVWTTTLRSIQILSPWSYGGPTMTTLSSLLVSAPGLTTLSLSVPSSRPQLDLGPLAATLTSLTISSRDFRLPVQSLATLHRLEVCDLRDMRCDILEFDKVISAVRSWPRLRGLHLGRVNTTNPALDRLTAILETHPRPLAELTLPLFMRRVHESTLLRLFAACQRLTSLTIPWSLGPSASSALQQSPLASLTTLSMVVTPVDVSFPRILRHFHCLRRLVVRSPLATADVLVTCGAPLAELVVTDCVWSCGDAVRVVSRLGLVSLSISRLTPATQSPLPPEEARPLVSLTSFHVMVVEASPCNTAILHLVSLMVRVREIRLVSAYRTYSAMVDLYTSFPPLAHLERLVLPRSLTGPPRMLPNVAFSHKCPRLRILVVGMRVDGHTLELLRSSQIIVRTHDWSDGFSFFPDKSDNTT
jgi:hypothetical protein